MAVVSASSRSSCQLVQKAHLFALGKQMGLNEMGYRDKNDRAHLHGNGLAAVCALCGPGYDGVVGQCRIDLGNDVEGKSDGKEVDDLRYEEAV
jgi:hypothetical protein